MDLKEKFGKDEHNIGTSTRACDYTLASILADAVNQGTLTSPDVLDLITKAYGRAFDYHLDAFSRGEQSTVGLKGVDFLVEGFNEAGIEIPEELQTRVRELNNVYDSKMQGCITSAEEVLAGEINAGALNTLKLELDRMKDFAAKAGRSLPTEYANIDARYKNENYDFYLARVTRITSETVKWDPLSADNFLGTLKNLEAAASLAEKPVPKEYAEMKEQMHGIIEKAV